MKDNLLSIAEWLLLWLYGWRRTRGGERRGLWIKRVSPTVIIKRTTRYKMRNLGEWQ